MELERRDERGVGEGERDVLKMIKLTGGERTPYIPEQGRSTGTFSTSLWLKIQAAATG